MNRTENGTANGVHRWVLLYIGNHRVNEDTTQRFLDGFRSKLMDTGGGLNIADEPALYLLADDDNLHKDAMDSLMREFRGSLKLFIHLASFVVRAGRGDAQLLTDMAQKFRTFMEPRQRADRKANPPDRRQLASGSGQQSSSAGGDGKRQPEGAKPKYPIGYGAIEEICQKLDARELLQGSSDLFMAANVPQLFQRLDELWPHADKQEKLLRAIVAAASASSSDLLSMTHDFLMKVLDSKLIETCLKEHVVHIWIDERKQRPPYTTLTEHLVELLFLGMDRLPTKAEKHQLSIDGLATAIRKCPHLYSQTAKNTLDRLEVVFEAHMKSKVSKSREAEKKPKAKPQPIGSVGPPPEDFRQIPIIPGLYDIVDQRDVFLRPARNVGRYDDDEHYLDVQFRLLREDLVRPLRDGIIAYRHKGGGTKGTDLFVYRDVTVSSPAMNKQTGDMLCNIQIKIRNKRMRWNKRFIYGSLVCLSTDEFHNDLVFAVVKDRDEKNLVQGVIGMKMENLDAVDYNAKYIMVESPAFFEAYRHVLDALQAMPPNEPVPFSEYLVAVETDVDPPQYMLDGGQLDIKTLAKEEAKRKEPRLVVPLHIRHHLTARWCGMDDSQYDALCHSLTSELTVIQGPPGTGKTWMGLQLTRLLLDNEQLWNREDDKRPILVVCFTNHALDQFLEGISEFCPNDIVRVGGRCKNENLQQYTLAKVRTTRSRWDNWRVRNEFFETRDATKRLAEQLAQCSAHLKQMEEDIVEPDSLVAGLNGFDEVADPADDEVPAGLGADVHKVARNADELVKWLTGAEKTCPMDLTTVRTFMQRGMPEADAKKASLTLTSVPLDQAVVFWRQNRAVLAARDEWKSAGEQVRSWPAVRDVETLLAAGIDLAVAIQILATATNKTAAALVNDFRAARLATLANRLDEWMDEEAIEPAAAEDDGPDNEELDLLREENERDAMEQDNFLDGINWEQPAKKGKKKGAKNAELRLKTFLPYINATKPFEEGVPVYTADHCQSLIDRWQLYQEWKLDAGVGLAMKVERLQLAYGNAMRHLTELRSLGDLGLLKAAKVVGMTTTGAAMHQAALRALKPRIVIVEEAAEVLEAHLLTSLTVACEHAILIGDHKQLRPNPAVYELAKKYNFDISLFERLINNRFPYRMLKKQHRMRPEISRTLMPHFYPELEDDDSVFNRADVLGMKKNMVFISHNQPELMDQEFKSHANPYEAEYAIRLAIYLMQQGYDISEVTILCTYLEQLLALRRETKKHPILDGIRIENVDNYQGEECRVIILSLVRSTNPKGTIGFLNVPNRVCVALSRAKDGFYVLGNFEYLASKCALWKNIRDNVEEKGMLYANLPVRCQNHATDQEITAPKDFDTKCPEGGCRIACNVRLECGHTCEKPCHALDAEHKLRKCTKPCGRTCPSEHRHPCKKLCYEDCGLCKITVKKELPCGHSRNAACHLNPEQVKCSEPCQRKLLCGHPCEERCSSACTAKCMQVVVRRMPCGHEMPMKCHQTPADVKCTKTVRKIWPLCNHSVDARCSDDVNKLPCPKPCGAAIPGCEHKCEGTCGKCRSGRLHILCKQNCGRTLICGHPCESKCSKSCPPCSKPCETACGHSQCSKAGSFGGKQMPVRKNTDHKDYRKKVGRLCGDPCPPCLEKCFNRCAHRECGCKCSEVCDVAPCTEPCKKPLKCSPKEKDAEKHLCPGVCGEECIQICRICDKEKFEELQEVFLGHEDEEDAKYVQLKDCGHIFEIRGIDFWVQDAVEKVSGEVVTIKCPRCSTAIRRSKRYVRLLNQRAADIEKGKRVIHGADKATLATEWADYLQQFARMVQIYSEATAPVVKRDADLAGDTTLSKFGTKLALVNTVFGGLSVASVTAQWLVTARNIQLVFERFIDLQKEICATEAFKLRLNPAQLHALPQLRALVTTAVPNGDLWKYLADDFTQLVHVLANKDHLQPSQAVSDTVLQQLSCECQRLSFMTDLVNWIVKAVEHGRDLNSAALLTLKEIFNALVYDKEFNGAHEVAMKAAMQRLMEQHAVTGFSLSDKEIIQIKQALGGHVTSWYKCSKGHIYGIGECGGAVETSRCPECNETIGGANHRLVASSQQATEMTGGRPPSPQLDPFVAYW